MELYDRCENYVHGSSKKESLDEKMKWGVANGVFVDMRGNRIYLKGTSYVKLRKLQDSVSSTISYAPHGHSSYLEEYLVLIKKELSDWEVYKTTMLESGLLEFTQSEIWVSRSGVKSPLSSLTEDEFKVAYNDFNSILYLSGTNIGDTLKKCIELFITECCRRECKTGTIYSTDTTLALGS